MKHTPGPWAVREEYGKLCIRPTNKDVKGRSFGYAPIAKVVGDKRINNDSANARLIAAAPDLLAALERMINDFYEDPLGANTSDAIDAAYAAIAKAKGQ